MYAKPSGHLLLGSLTLMHHFPHFFHKVELPWMGIASFIDGRVVLSCTLSTKVPLLPLPVARQSQKECFSAVRDRDAGLTSPIMPGRRQVKAGLGMASIHRGRVEATESKQRRDKFALFHKQCSQVLNHHIYVGSDAVARDLEVLRANGITHVLNCVGYLCPEYFKGDLFYRTLWLQDSPCEDITSLLYDVFDYFEEVREHGGRVFVHCHQGVSRSTALVIAYVMWRECSSFRETLKAVKTSRGVANPNMGFACQLLQCQKFLHRTSMNPKSVPRMYMVAPHSSYDPLHLVPKALLIPGADCLDSRGAFIVRTPSAVLVWVGYDCDPLMGRAAEKMASQIIRYEKAEGHVKVFAEGNEDVEFWKSFGYHLHSRSRMGEIEGDGCSELEKSKMCKEDDIVRFGHLDVHCRKNPAYDTDYALYETARLGGIIPPMPCIHVGSRAAVSARIPVREDGWRV